MGKSTTKNEGSSFINFAKKAEEFAPEFKSLWKQTQDSLFRVGDMLIELKSELEHGKWEDAFEENADKFPFSFRIAQKLMFISGFEPFKSKDIREALPVSIEKMEKIVKLTGENHSLLAELVADGAIHSKVTNKAISKAFGVEATTAGSTSKGLGLPSEAAMLKMSTDALEELVASLIEKQSILAKTQGFAQFLLRNREATANDSLKLAA